MTRRSDNILVVANYPPNPGYAWWLMERCWLKINQLCEERTSECYVAYPQAGTPSKKLARSSIRPVVCDFGDRSRSGVTRALEVIQDCKIGGIYFVDHNFFDPRFGRFRMAGVKTIVNHDHTPGDRAPRTGLAGLIKALRNRFGPLTCDHWISLSPLMQERALLNGRIPASKCSIVQNGIRPIEPHADARARFREEFGIPESSVVVVTIGRAHSYKGVDLVIEVARRTVKEFGREDICFVYFGDGPALPDLQRLAKIRGLSEANFRFAGNRTTVRDLLCGCDIALHAAKGEGFSLAILEYMSAGLAVLVPDRPSVCQAIDHDRTGWIYPAGDVSAATDALLELASESERRSLMGLAAQEKVRLFYHQERMGRDFDALIRRIFPVENR